MSIDLTDPIFNNESAAVRELAHIAQALGRLHLLFQHVQDLLVKARDHAGQKQARGNRIDANTNGTEFARGRHVHTDNSRLGSSVGALSDLAFVCRDYACQAPTADPDTLVSQLTA